jgi:sugar lactone lactonase YvrE
MNPLGIVFSGHSPRPYLPWTAMALAAALSGCGGDSTTPAQEAPPAAAPSPAAPSPVAPSPVAVPTHVLGGSISGLTGAGLTIANGRDTLSIPVGGTTFSMATPVQTGTAYALTVTTQPAGQKCSFANAAGTMPDADMRNAVLTCAATSYSVGGAISGLSANGLVLANGSDTVSVAQGAASFTFPAPVATGSNWSVTVSAQPAGQVCTVANGSGQVSDAAVNVAEVNCATIPVAAPTYRVGGRVSGLQGNALVLVNGNDTASVSANGSFTFNQALTSGATYNVVVRTPPTGQSCTVSNGAGTAASADVSDVTVACASNTYTLGGSISGLTTSGLVLSNNGSDTLSVAANASLFTMSQPVAYGASYNLTVQTQPTDLLCTLTNGSGTMGSANVTDVTVGCAAIAYQVSTLAGNGTSGYVDGSAATAQFRNVFGVAVDGSGNTFVADTGNHSIRKITSDGTVSTLAGNGTSGFADGSASNARFSSPQSVAVDRNGNVFVADSNNSRIRKIAPDGTVSTLAGNGAAGFADGAGTAARFSYPSSIAIDGAGNLYVADTNNNRIRKILPDGTVNTVAGSGTQGSADGGSTTAQFNYPRGVAVDSSGIIFVADTSNYRVRKIALDGTVSTFAGSTRGYAEGSGTAAQFSEIYNLAVDTSGNVLVPDLSNSRIRKISPDGTVSTRAGSGVRGFADGDASTAQFSYPIGVAVDAAGTVFVADYLNSRIRKIAP